ncbi:MAG: hypothetical protein A3G34_10370 [Candidatus Lindowbacteria bacterium RIFCSPLOWO2_12_FULL_62_27]|nr:MAG: hypothetical protein A3G34_10370 [Candidatus Lindowbacteria bacterium RIFCSPLOWO2_12_FULL_62_27]OGH63489.1 MAG: hypothetical protein A3I06_12175 [Candidatus Lindowbacteria bacterium RIFCSPLOWO2_02_FULL_62_12]
MLICNIDGTIADNAHRRRLLADGTFDWDYFLRPDLISQDRVFPYAREVLTRLTVRHPMILLSGREERFRSISRAWLAEQGLPAPTKLYLRPDGDRRTSTEFKTEILSRIIEHAHEAVSFVDDNAEMESICARFGIQILRAPQIWEELFRYIHLL